MHLNILPSKDPCTLCVHAQSMIETVTGYVKLVENENNVFTSKCV